MDDFLEQTAIRQKKGVFTLLYYFVWLCFAVCTVIALFSLSGFIGTDLETGNLVFRFPFLLIGAAFGALAFFLFRAKDECRIEYDYSFTNGSLDISKVMNERRRRYLCALETRDVIACGPATGPAFQKALREPGIRQHNWFVNREAKLYYFYFQKKGVKHLAVMELNDDMIAVIRSKKYLQAGAWHDANGKSSYASVS